MSVDPSLWATLPGSLPRQECMGPMAPSTPLGPLSLGTVLAPRALVLSSGAAGHTCSLLVFEECDPAPLAGPCRLSWAGTWGPVLPRPQPQPGRLPAAAGMLCFHQGRLSLHRFCWLAWGRPQPDPPILSPFPANCC